MDAIATYPIVIVSRVAVQATCYLCGVLLSDTETGLLCLVCQGEEDAQWRDYQAERELACWPFLN